jgi:hypothetical protein
MGSGLPQSPVEFSSYCCFTSFPAPDCCACATTPAFSGWLVYLQLTWEVVFTPLLLSFPPIAALQAFLLLIAGRVPQLLTSPASL